MHLSQIPRTPPFSFSTNLSLPSYKIKLQNKEFNLSLKKMLKNSNISASLFLLIFLCISVNALKTDDGWWWGGGGPVVKRVEERKTLVETEYGEISAVDISDDRLGHYHLQFITLEPNSLFLPVLLHSDMVFYVHTGSGRLSWLDDEDLKEVDLRRGDVYRLHPGSILYMQSNLETEREKLRIYALFSSTEEDSYEPAIGAYSAVTDLVLGFDKRILREAFMVSEEVIEDIVSATKPPLIVHAVGVPLMKAKPWQLEARFLKAFVGSGMVFNKKKKDKKRSVYNIYEEDPDFENCNGWSLTVTKKDSHLLRGSNVGLFMVYLNPRAMMGPHWNPMAFEIAVVTEGQGMVRVVCASTAKSFECKNTRFKVNKGDVFMIPRFHPMAQMSFNNGSFVFVGFSTTTSKNRPQYVAGKSSVLQNLDRKVLVLSLNVNETAVDRFLAAQNESLILECPSCAEEEERVMEEEAKKEREKEEEREREEERKREEEEAKKREEERKREEEKRKREEEERKREEEKAKEEEEKRKREEEERRREEEEEKAKEEEERAKKEEEKRKREEEERKREEEERMREEEKAREEEEARKREEERKKEEEEEAREREEERKKEQEEEEKEAREREEEKKKQEEEAREREGEVEREQEEARKRQEEAQKEEEERQKQRAREEEEWRRVREAEEREREREKEEVRRILKLWT